MSPVVDEQQDEWIGVRRASQIAGVSPYSLQKFAIAGVIRTRLRPPFRTVYSRADAEAVARSFASL
jgi:hypothetical protein